MSQASLEIDSPVGNLLLESERDALVTITFADRTGTAERRPAPNALLREARRQLSAYFGGQLTAFDLPLAPRGTEFQQQVWAALADIPCGETRSYGEIARAIGRPKAVRAVGLANGANPLPIVLPCHRVIGSNGSLTGYGGGLDRKRTLLALEGIIID